MIPSRSPLTLAALAAVAALAAAPVPQASAVVPPKDCGRLTVAGKRHQVKADQISCRTARTYTRRYLERRIRPRGYRCTSYPSRKNRMRFYCHSGRKVFFAIRR